MAPRRVNVFNISSGTPFLSRTVEAIMAGELVPGFPDRDDPLSLASATILVPTQRAAQELRRAFVALGAETSVLLPRIQTFAWLADEQDADDADNSATAGLPNSVSPMERRLILTRLISHWARMVRRVPADKDDETGMNLIAGNPGHAYRLAGDLAALIDELAIEGVPWERLNDVAPEEFDRYWQLTLSFLKIATEGWAAYLTSAGTVDRIQKQAMLVNAQIERLTSQNGGPIIAIGSTGTNKSTARLLNALARSPRGAVVLPGLDMHLDAPSWELIGPARDLGTEGSAGHPQAALFRLLRELEISRDDVTEIGTPTPALAARSAFLSQALRPPDSTDMWAELRARQSVSEVDYALQDMAIIEASDEREEALALAVAMREVLESPTQTAILITPDRGLALRVKSELDRWGIDVDDSAGESLRTTAAGSLARRMLDLASGPIDISALLALVAHPGLTLRRSEPELQLLAQTVEIGVARCVLPRSQTILGLMQAARATAGTRDAHPLRRAISNKQWDALESLGGDLDLAFRPLRQLGDNASMDRWAAAHLASFSCLSEQVDEGSGPGSEAVMQVLTEFLRPEAGALELSAFDYTVLLDQALTEQVVRQVRPSHPRLQILGLLEARLVRADVVLLAGLDEAIWPPQSQSGAFLNRPMRSQLGLSPPERRIGQTAHDFVQALGMPTAIMSRARKRGGAPTVTSRLIQRLQALAGDRWDVVKQKGDRYLDLARKLDAPLPSHMTRGGARPTPRPALHLRPTKLSVTRIETLRRDPYSIYAERILRLLPLDQVGPEAGLRESGILLHEIISHFSESAHLKSSAPDEAEILSLAEAAFHEFLKAPDFRVFRWPRIQAELSAFVKWERARKGRISTLFLERSGSLPVTLADGSEFVLTAQADRIEVHRDGSLVVVDFKSGRVPTANEIVAGFAPQLVLESEMLRHGAFKEIPAAEDVTALYVKLGTEDGVRETPVGNERSPLRQLMLDQFQGLQSLISQFRDPATAYVSRPYPQFVNRYGRYDHLARVKEWSTMIGEA